MEELLPSLLPSQRAREGACDVTGRDPKSLFIGNTAPIITQINSIYPKTNGFIQIFENYLQWKPSLMVPYSLPVTSQPGSWR